MKNNVLLLLLLLTGSTILSQNYFDYTYDIGNNDYPKAMVCDTLGNTYISGWYEDTTFVGTHAFAMKIDNNGNEVWRKVLNEESKYYSICYTPVGNIYIGGSINDYCYRILLNSETGEKIWDYSDTTTKGYWYGTANYIENNGEISLQSYKTIDSTHLIALCFFDNETGIQTDTFVDVNSIYSPMRTDGKVSDWQTWSAIENLVMCNTIENYCFIWTFQSVHIAGIQEYAVDTGCVVRLFYWPQDHKYYMGVLCMCTNVSGVFGNAFLVDHYNFEVTGSGAIGYDKLLVTGSVDNELSLWVIDHALSGMQEILYPAKYSRLGIDVFGLKTRDMIIMGQEFNIDGSVDIFLKKVDSIGTVGISENISVNTCSVYPNPGTNSLNIKTPNSKYNFELINFSGNIIASSTITGVSNSINTSNLASGIYFYRLLNVETGKVETGKWIKR